MHGGVFLCGECVEFAAQIFQPAIYLVGLPSGGSLEDGVLGEVSQTVLAGRLVAAAGVYYKSAVRHGRFDAFVYAAQSVVER